MNNFFSPELIVIATVVLTAFGVAIFLKPTFGLALLAPSLFLESDAFSLSVAGARIRIYHILIVILFARLMFDVFVRRAKKWNRTPLDGPLALYALINIGAITQAVDAYQSIKVGSVIVLLTMLYFILTNFGWTRQSFVAVLKYFFAAGLMELTIGLYQIGSQMAVALLHINLPLMEKMQSDIISFGRPYGTFVEPDWFGFATALLFFITGVLAISMREMRNKSTLVFISAAFLLGNILSVTRGSWVALAAGIALVPALHHRLVTRDNKHALVRSRLFVFGGIASALLVIILAIAVPQVQSVIHDRFASITNPQTLNEEPRVQTMLDSFTHIQEKPLLGNGPGSYKIIGITPFVQERDREIAGYEPFLTNIFLTVLNDTGVIGLVVFLIILWRFFLLARQALARTDTDPQLRLILFALFLTNVLMLVSFQITTGFWLGIAWFLMALLVVSAQLTQKSSRTAAQA